MDVNQVMSEIIDKALTNATFVDKKRFYKSMQREYGITPADVPQNYEKFHKLLSDLYGLKHFKIERDLVQILHQRAMRREYKEIQEIPAFEILVKSYFKETKEAIAESKLRLQEAEARLADIEKKQNEIQRKGVEKQ